MRRFAWVYIIGVMLSALALSTVAFVQRPQDNPPVWLFVGLTAVATLQRIFRIVAPGNKVYESSTISLFAGALLLPPWLFVLMVVVAHAIEWAKMRLAGSNSLRAWYIQPFNMAKCILGGMSVYAVIALIPDEAWVNVSVAHIAAILSSVIVYVAANQLLLGVALALARRVSFRQAGIMRDAVLIEVPLACIGYVAVELMNRSPLAALFVLAPIALIYQAFMLPKMQDEAMRALESVNLNLTNANQAIRQLNDELFLTLAKVFDTRDPYVGGHAAQVAAYAVAIAHELGLPAEQVEMMRQSAYLHDIGKIAIPEVILHKPGRLTDIEYDFLKRHSDIGADLVATSHGLRHLAPFIRHHHERWDGGGYPMRLAGKVIPLEARILGLCDAVEAMASDRPYHRALSSDEIVAELQRCAGTQFDPEVAEAFIRVARREGAKFVVNSARSVAMQYAGSELAAQSLAASLFATVYATGGEAS